jgi:hypothetical protein
MRREVILVAAKKKKAGKKKKKNKTNYQDGRSGPRDRFPILVFLHP